MADESLSRKKKAYKVCATKLNLFFSERNPSDNGRRKKKERKKLTSTTTWNMKLLVNWIRYVFCDFDMFTDWKSFGLRVNGLLTRIRLIDMSVDGIEGIALMLMFGVIAETDATVETIRRNIATCRLSILREINGAAIEMALLGNVADLIVGNVLHLIFCTLSDVTISVIVCAVCVTARTTVMARVE